MKNPLFEEQLRVGFISSYMVRLHLAGLGIITLIIFLFYPGKDISYFLARSVKPEMFNIALYSVIVFLIYLTIKTAIFSIQDTKVISMKDWFVYTKLKESTYFWGRISYGLFYTFFIVIIFVPLLLLAASVSGLGPYNILALLLFVYLFLLNLFMLGLLFYTFFRKQNWVLNLILWFSVIVTMLLSPSFFPENHPTILILKLQKSTELFTDLQDPLVFLLSSIIILATLSWLSILLYSRRIHEK